MTVQKNEYNDVEITQVAFIGNTETNGWIYNLNEGVVKIEVVNERVIVFFDDRIEELPLAYCILIKKIKELKNDTRK